MPMPRTDEEGSNYYVNRINVLLFIGNIVSAVMTFRNNQIINSTQLTFTYREERGGVVYTLPRGTEITLQFGKDSVKILRSYQLRGIESIYGTVMFVRFYADEKGYEVPRKITEMYGEIRLHNMLYNIGYRREHTADCDLDYKADRRWYVNAASKFIGWTEYNIKD